MARGPPRAAGPVSLLHTYSVLNCPALALPAWARQNRQFLKRAGQFVAGQGIDQFLDIGTGLPTVENTHEVAHGINPNAQVVYTDHDPLVLTGLEVVPPGLVATTQWRMNGGDTGTAPGTSRAGHGAAVAGKT